MNVRLKENRKEAFNHRKNVAVQRLEGCPSYGPGILDSGAGPSGDMGSVPHVFQHNTITDISVNQFVVVPFGPKWFVAKVVEVSTSLAEVQVEYLETADNYATFQWSEEPLCWEFTSQILMSLPDPEVAPSTTSSRLYLQFPPACINKAHLVFQQWRKQKSRPKNF